MKNLSFTIFIVLLISFSATSFAQVLTYETYVATEDSLLTVVGQTPGEQLGASITSGDFNNDGIEDLVVGSPFSSSSLKEWNGRVSIIFGSTAFKSPNIDLAQRAADISFYGERSGDQLGTSITTGDFNNDGYVDIAIGAHNALVEESRIGKVYVVYGSSNWDKRAFDFATTDPDVLFIGHSEDDDFGIEVHAADINNDTFDDLLIGAPDGLGPDNNRTGAVSAFFGADNGFDSNVYNLSSVQADVNFYGHEEGQRFGSVIRTGFISNQEKLDLVIGAYRDDSDEGLVDSGSVYIYEGRNNYLKTIKSATTTISANEESNWFGFDVAVGDMNADGKDDIAVSAFPYLTTNRAAKVFVFYGGNRFKHDGFKYSSEKYDVLLDSPTNGLYLGASVILEDFDRDDRADLVVGAPGIGRPTSAEAGNVYALFSQGEDFNRNYGVRAQNVTSTIFGLNPDDWFGYEVSSLDINGDGFLDLAVGSRYSEGNASVNNGKVFVVFGDGNPFGMPQEVVNPGDRYISRAEFIAMVIDSFDLEAENQEFIDDCYQHMEFCLFNFTARSRYSAINLDPLNMQLYPDVDESYQYYHEINTATILGLINGFMNESNSPFRPEEELSRIQALKIILGANGLVENKYEFEIENVKDQRSYFDDVNSEISHMWWYPRYTNFAVEEGILADGRFFRPDDGITYTEAVGFIEQTASYLNGEDEET